MKDVAAGVALDADLRLTGWARAVPAFALALIALAVPMWEPARRLLDLWLNNGSYGHGVLIVPIMIYLVWVNRGDFLRFTPSPSALGLACLAGLMVVWLASRLLGIVMGEQLVLVAALLCTTWAVMGFRIAVAAAPVILYLMVAVPIWTYLTPWLQVNTALASSNIVRFAGVPIFLEGLYMTIPDGQFLVAEVCSGMRYLLAGLSLGGFYALLNLRLWWTRTLLVAVSFVLGIVFNWVRVAGIALVGHYSQMQSPMVKNHLGYGWVMFLLVVIGVLVVGRLLERVEESRQPAEAREVGSGASARGGSAFMLAAVLSAVVTLAPAAFASAWMQAPAAPLQVPLAKVAIPGGWAAEAAADESWKPVYGVTDGDAQLTFERAADGVRVDVFVAFYVTQRQDAEAVNDANKPFDYRRWKRYALRAVADRVDLARAVPGEEYLLREVDGSARRLVWRTHWMNGAFVVGARKAKIQQLMALVSGRRAAAALLFSTPVSDSEDQARQRLREFLDDSFPALRDMLQEIAAKGAAGS